MPTNNVQAYNSFKVKLYKSRFIIYLITQLYHPYQY